MSTQTQTPARKKNPTEEKLDAIIDRAVAATSLEHWEEFIRDLKVPGDFMPAIMTRRPELFRLVQPRPLNETEMKAILDAFAGLIETNWALQEHTRQLAQMVSEWVHAFKGLNTLGRRIEHFANFRSSEREEDDDRG